MKKRLISIVTMMAMLASMLSVGVTVSADTAPTPVAATQNQNQGDGIVLKKSATANPVDGTVDIMIDAYTTGRVSNQATATPADIVLVLDVSGSMANKYADVYTYNAIDGGSYISGWDFFTPIYGYGFSSDGTTYYVDDGGTYRAVTLASGDANRFRYYYYTDENNARVYVYPKLGSSVDTEGATREHTSYPVVQFYKGANTSVSMMQALQNSVDNFIDQTFTMNSAIADAAQKHRIAVVKYADDSYYSSSGAISDINGALSSAIGNNRFRSGNDYYNYTQLVHDFAVVDEAGDASLKAAVDALQTGGATAVDYGLKMAQATLNKRTPAEMAARKEVVIVFSDGEPTHGSKYSQSVAGEAINIALALKNAGTVVYSLSVLAGANSTVIDGTTDTNKFMHYISNNYPKASYNASAETITAGTGGNPKAGYYMTPATEQNLTSMFEHIIQQIGKPDISLGRDTAVVDTLSRYFDLKTETLADVKIDVIKKTLTQNGVDGNGKPIYEAGYALDSTAAETVKTEISDNKKQILINNFDFDENYISTEPRTDGFGGRILRITITVTPDYDAIDNMETRTSIVPTNEAYDPAKVVSPDQAEPIATTASPSVGLKKISYQVDGESFANGDHDVYRLPGSDYTVIFEPTREGHTFSGWSETGTIKMPANDVVISGSFTPNPYNITYKYVGTVPSGVVPADPTTHNESDVLYGTQKPVAQAPTTPKGYTFSGWSADNVTPVDGSFKMPAGNVEFAGSFKANGNTQFKIEHYLQNLDGSYPITATESYTDYGTTDTTATAVPNQYTGFTFDADHTDNILSGTIAGDGSLVLKLYYERNSYTVSYAYTGELPGSETDIRFYGGTYKFGDDVTVKDAASAAGYDFHGWISEEVNAANGTIFKMPARNVTFNGHFVAQGDTGYKVKHYKQLLDGNYPTEADLTAEHTGQTDSPVEAMPIYFEGFLFDADNQDNVKTGTIAGDGSLVLKLYYEREKHDVDYEYIGIIPSSIPDGIKNPDVWNKTGVMYKASVQVEATPNLAGYSFDGWRPYNNAEVVISGDRFEMPNRDVQLRGQFIPLEVSYTVKHIAQDTNSGSTYTTELGTETLKAYTGASVTAVRKDFTGYTFNEAHPDTVKTGTVLGDGSLVLYLYYDRNPLYKVEYAFAGNVPAGVTVPTEPDHIEGEDVTLKEPVGTYDGYTFSGWTSYGKALQNAAPGTTFDMPARDVHLTGYFTPNPTGYTVKYYFENVGDNDYSIDNSKTKTVTKEENKVFVGDSIVAAAENFEGFKLKIAPVDAYDTEYSVWTGIAKANPDENVLKLYYDRLEYNVSYAYWDIKPEGAPDISVVDYPQEVHKYGATVTIKPDLSWDGTQNQFQGWYSAQTGTQPEDTHFTMPAKDVVLVGSFISIANVASYKVEHYTETSYGSNTYALHSFKNIEGAVVGEQVTAKAETISGYTYNPSHPDNSAMGLVLAGNALVLRLYYTKNYSGGGGGGGTRQYILTYESNGGTKFSPEKHNSGKVVELDKTPKKDGYIFDGWHLDKELAEDVNEVKMTKNITVYANWIEDNGAAGNGHETPGNLNGDDHFAYVIGYPDGTVRPNANITRAEVTSIFFRLLKDDVRKANLIDSNSFGDVDSKEWYNTAISTMTKLGIVKGRFKDAFVPDANITRAEFAVICARFDESEFTISDNFSDVIGHWAENEIHEAAAHGWIRGYEDNTFKPDQNITRAEAMTMINRVLNRVPENKDSLLDDMIKWPDNKEADWHYLAVQEATNSHEYEKINKIYEKWAKLADGTDWKVYEQ